MRKSVKILLLAMLTALVSITFVFISGCGKKSGDGGNKSELSFELNGGAGVEDVTVDKGEEFELPIPVYEGYIFDGWYTNAQFTGSPVEKVVVDGDITYYAKWSKGYKVNFELDGGSLSTTYVYVKEGANVYDAVNAYVPTKDGVQFGAWFNGDTELAKNLRMPTTGLTLTAKYKVPYTVELWGQNLAQTDYEKIGESVIGYEYAGVSFTSTQAMTGFKEIQHANSVTTKTISETTSENVFKHYFDRESYTVRFDANYPDGSKSEVKTETVVYGNAVVIPSNYVAEGYCLIGWATSANGTIVYESNFLAKNLYNADTTEVEDITFNPERNTTLYGVWKKGATDMFGSDDYIYLFDATSEEIYLSRGEVFFKGDYNAEKKTFRFIVNGKAKFPGKVINDELYIYTDNNRAGNKTRYENGKGLVETEYIYVDKDNEISYFVEGEGGLNTESKGTYIVDENGYYVATFTEGPKAGETLTMLVGTYQEKPVYILRNEAEYTMGDLTMFGEYNGMIVPYNIYQIRLTGFGTALFNQGMSAASYYATMEDGVITLKNEYGMTYLVGKLMEKEGLKGYAVYDSNYDKTYTTVEGGTLVLDGTYNATYTLGNEQVTGLYTVEKSIFGSTIVTLKKDGTYCKFLITSEEVDLGDGQKTTQYTVERKHADYAEYNYRNDENYWYAPMLVINNEKAGDAIVYGYTKTGEYVEVSRGTYEETDKKGIYKYTAKTFANAEDLVDVGTTPWDITTITSFVFAIDTVTTNYKLYYWYSAEVGGEAENFDVVYTSAEEEKLTLVAGLAIYEGKGQLIIGAYEKSESGTMLRMAEGSGYKYFEINETEKTILTLAYAPYMAYLLGADGSMRKDAALTFDGKGGVTYSVLETVDGESKQVDYEGVETSTGTTAFDYYIYQFTCTSDSTKSFTYLKLTMNSGSTCIAVYNSDYNGVYESNDGMLTLDGYGFIAEFASSNGTKYRGVYMIAEENVIVLMAEDTTLYFDLKAERNFTVRGVEHGEYVMMYNQALPGVFVTLDGYGKASVYTKEKNAEGVYENVYIDENGTYTQNGSVVTVKYQDGDNAMELDGEFAIYSISGSQVPVYLVLCADAARTYVDKDDWSVMTLDKSGNATKYSTDGKKSVGAYVLITDKLFYYADDEGANIYNYDVINGVVTVVKSLENRAYYTPNLESLQFTKYGFAIFNGVDRYYYNMEGSKVVLYRQDFNDENANAYGFITEDMGVLTDQPVTYQGKTYYFNDGYNCEFTREAESKDKYPVLVEQGKTEEEDVYGLLEKLTFAPTGAANFSNVEGSVYINGEKYRCYITRQVHEDNTVEMYLLVGKYRFDINVNYTGLDNDGNSTSTYEVTRMRYINTLDSYVYMYYLYQYYMYYQIMIDNVFGTVYMTTEFNEDGSEQEGGPYFTAEFGELSNIVDSNGDPIEFVNLKYTDEEDVITVDTVGKDGYTYRLYIGKQYNQMLRQYGYLIYALTRVQEFTTADSEYTVNVERVITTEASGIYPGYPMFLKLTKGTEVIQAELNIFVDGGVEYVVRTRETTTDGSQGKITATTYYKILFEEEKNTSIEGSEEETTNIVAAYKSVTVTEMTTTTMYTEDESSYVDITSEGIRLMSVNGTLYLAVECAYDEATNTYTIKTSNGKSFTVQVLEDNQVAITEVVEEESKQA
ncbi:MAG: InlB B-repeat-containing protein [Clostridia bacterium]|nr:InlB B-repeat-containing protein [Clostridia bacterium]